MRAAASRTFCTAGRRSAIRMAIMAITTSNSMRVNAARLRRDMVFHMKHLRTRVERIEQEGLTQMSYVCSNQFLIKVQPGKQIISVILQSLIKTGQPGARDVAGLHEAFSS